MQAEGAKAPPDCRRIVIRLRYGIKGRCDRWATCTGEECLVNVHHAKSRLILETCGHSGQKTRARRQPARTGPDAGHPLQRATPNDLTRRAINVQLARATSDQSRAIQVTRVALSLTLSAMIGPIPKLIT